MKALIVGGTGCISSEISALAAKKPGMELYLLHRGNRPQFVPPGAHSIQADIKKPDEVREKLKGMQFDVLAQFISYGVDDINRDLELFKGHFNQYMFISSTAVYRSRSPMEIITEDKAIVGNSVWAYGLHKLQAEMRLREERGKNGLNYTVVRPSFTYNNLRIFHPVVRDDHQHYSWTLADRILKDKPLLMFDDGNALCTLTYAADFAKAFVGLMGNPNACGEAYHIACDEYFTYNRVAEMIGEALGTPTRLCHVPAHLLGFEFGTHYGEKLISFGHGGLICSAKVRKAVPEFVCTTYFAEGIRECIRFYDENPSFKVVNPEWDAEMDRIVVKYGNGVRIG